MTGSEDKTVRLWSLADSKLLCSAERHDFWAGKDWRSRLQRPVAGIQHVSIISYLGNEVEIEIRIDPFRLIERALNEDAVGRKSLVGRCKKPGGADIDIDPNGPRRFPHGG